MELVEDIIFDRRPDATERLVEFAKSISSGGSKREVDLAWREGTVEQRLAHAVLHGEVAFIEEEAEEARVKYGKPLHDSNTGHGQGGHGHRRDEYVLLDAYMSAQLDQGYFWEAGVPVLLAHATPRPPPLLPAERAVVYRSTVRTATAQAPIRQEVALAGPPRRPAWHPVAVHHVLHPPPVRVAAHAVAKPLIRPRVVAAKYTAAPAVAHTREPSAGARHHVPPAAAASLLLRAP